MMNNRRLGVLSSEEFIESICIDDTFINGRYDTEKKYMIVQEGYDMPILYDTEQVDNLACAYSFYIMYFSFVLSKLVTSDDLYIVATLDHNSIFFSVCRASLNEEDTRAESVRTGQQVILIK